MKRKFLFSGMAALIALAMVFAGCAQPTDMNINTDGVTTLVKLDNPVVHVTAYDGFNVVSWEPVRDAASYTVWRVDTQSSSQVDISSVATIGDNTIIDNVTESWEKLANGRTYKYIVIAVPDAARYADVNLGTALAPDYKLSDAHIDIYSGRGEATVTARVPDPATYKVPKASDIKYRLDPNGFLYVSWTQPANAKAKIGYFIGGYPTDAALSPEAFDAAFYLYSDTYVAGTSTIDYLFTTSGAGYLYPRNAVTAVFPVIGGKATIAIQTEYLTDKTVQSTGNIYARDNPAKLDITLDQYNLELNWQGATFTATHIYKDATTGTVQLSWPRIQGDDDVYSSKTYSNSDTTKVTYNVYKREIPVNDDLNGALVGAGDWTKVNYTFQDRGDGDTSNTIYAVETGDVNSTLSGWYYIVYASANRGGKTSHSYPLSAYLARTLPAEATIATSTGVAYGGGKNSDGHPYTIRIDVAGLQDGVSYKLYRGELIPILIERLASGNTQWVDPDPSTLKYQFTSYDSAVVEQWIGARVTGDTSGSIFDTGIEPRKSYIYKLVSLIPGDTPAADILLGDGSTKQVVPTSTENATSVYSHLSLVTSTPTVIMSGTDANDNKPGQIHAAVSNSGYTKGMDVKLFYRRAATGGVNPGTTTTAWTYLATFDKYAQAGGDTTQITEESGVFKPKDYEIPGAVYGETYQFKAVAYIEEGAREIPNIDNDTYSLANIVEATATGPGILSQPRLDSLIGFTVTSLTGTHNITGITGSFVNGLEIYLRVVRTATPSAESGKSKYFVQPEPFTITRESGLSTYQLRFGLTVLPPEADAVGGGTDTYTIQYRYPWETWETVTPRQIGGNLTR
jgi:hypothetical protein